MKTLKCTYTDIKMGTYFSTWFLILPLFHKNRVFSLNRSHTHSKNFKRKHPLLELGCSFLTAEWLDTYDYLYSALQQKAVLFYSV